MRTPRWLDRRALLLLHSESLAEHGGLAGLRDEAALDSALARPLHILAYEDKPDMARLAAAYGFGLIRNHPFNDGNKRAGFLAILLLLDLNGYDVEFDQVEAVQTILRVAAGKMREADLANWIRAHIRRARRR